LTLIFGDNYDERTLIYTDCRFTSYMSAALEAVAMARLTARARSALTQDRRAQILDAAAREFTARGYDGATVRGIARRARLAEGTIYLYFPGKRDLLLAVWERFAVERMLPVLDEALELESGEEVLAAILTDRFELLRRHTRFFRLILQQADLDPVLRKAIQHRLAAMKTFIYQRLRDRAQDGAFRSLSVPIVMRMVAGVTIGMVLLEQLDADPVFERYSSSSIARHVARLLIHGMAAHGGVPAAVRQEAR
jgi:AcrR family transcriptional regulator